MSTGVIITIIICVTLIFLGLIDNQNKKSVRINEALEIFIEGAILEAIKKIECNKEDEKKED